MAKAKITSVLSFSVALVVVCSGAYAGSDDAKLSQGSKAPTRANEVISTKRVMVPDASKGFDVLTLPKQSRGTEVTFGDGTKKTYTDDGQSK
jgi:hypothetical protein